MKRTGPDFGGNSSTRLQRENDRPAPGRGGEGNSPDLSSNGIRNLLELVEQHLVLLTPEPPSPPQSTSPPSYRNSSPSGISIGDESDLSQLLTLIQGGFNRTLTVANVNGYANFDRLCTAIAEARDFESVFLCAINLSYGPDHPPYQGQGLYQMLEQSSSLRRLELNNIELDVNGWQRLREALSASTTLESFSMDDCVGLDVTRANAFVEELTLPASLTHFMIGGFLDQFDQACALAVSKLLAADSTIRHLELVDLAVAPDLLLITLQNLSRNRHLTRLKIAHISAALTVESVHGLIALLRASPGLTRLDLGNLQLDLEGARAWLSFLEAGNLLVDIEEEIEIHCTPEQEPEVVRIKQRLSELHETRAGT